MKTISIFNHLSVGFKNVDRAGTNVITEILHNRNNNAFAVMKKTQYPGLGGQNSAAILKSPTREMLTVPGTLSFVQTQQRSEKIWA